MKLIRTTLAALFLAGLMHSHSAVAAPPTMFTTETKLNDDDTLPFYSFGQSIAVDGDTVVVGSPNDDDGGYLSGSVYVFVRSGAGWTQQQKLTASDPSEYDNFGMSVSISGDTIVVGAKGGRSSSTSFGSARVFVRSGTTWTQQAKLRADDAVAGQAFGHDVAINGNTVAVGAVAADQGGTIGAAYVFVRSGTTWIQQQKLRANDAAAGQAFGASIAISGDTVAVGARFGTYPNPLPNAVYVFVRSGTTWTQQAKLTGNNAATDILLGMSVAISGDTVVAGAEYFQDIYGALPFRGSAYVFVRSGTNWSLQQKLTASDAVVGDGTFGSSVGISGETAVVGAYGQPSSPSAGTGPLNGSARVFVRSGNTWTQQQKLTGSDATAGEGFARSVGISDDTAVVGAPREGYNGSAYVYESESDNTPPVITSVATNPNVLWPPNHKMVPVSVAVTATDDSGGPVTGRIISVTSNEPVNGTGDGNTAPDWDITGAFTAKLRAERSGNGSGRIYTITVECQDTSGNLSTATVEVKVPKSQKK